jgi:PAS domain-containing protein
MEDFEALRLLHRFVARSADAVNPDALWSELCEVAVAVAEADFGNVQQMDDEAGLRIVSHRGLPAWWIDFWNAAGRGQGACSQALASGEPIVVEDVEASALFAGSAALQIQLRAGVRAVLSVPMVAASGETVGVLSTHYRKRHRPDQRQLHRLDLLARSAANLLDRRPAAATARHGEARLHALAAATGDAMYVARPGWERLRWLTRQAFVAGLPDDEEGWLGRHVDVADQQQLSEAIRTAIDACGPLDAEVRIHHPRFCGAERCLIHVAVVPCGFLRTALSQDRNLVQEHQMPLVCRGPDAFVRQGRRVLSLRSPDDVDLVAADPLDEARA